jgi:hypothetical protein
MVSTDQPLESVGACAVTDLARVRPANAWSVRRFWTVHFLQPWCKRPFGEPDAAFESRLYLIGFAAFAVYAGTGDIYLEITYSGLSSRGCRLTLSEKGEVREVELWGS